MKKLTILLASLSSSAYATAVGFDTIAQNLLGAEMNVRYLIKVLCIATGGAMILGSMFQYRKYRKNPIEVPLGKAVTTFIIGAALIILTFAPLQI